MSDDVIASVGDLRVRADGMQWMLERKIKSKTGRPGEAWTVEGYCTTRDGLETAVRRLEPGNDASWVAHLPARHDGKVPIPRRMILDIPLTQIKASYAEVARGVSAAVAAGIPPVEIAELLVVDHDEVSRLLGRIGLQDEQSAGDLQNLLEIRDSEDRRDACQQSRKRWLKSRQSAKGSTRNASSSAASSSARTASATP